MAVASLIAYVPGKLDKIVKNCNFSGKASAVLEKTCKHVSPHVGQAHIDHHKKAKNQDFFSIASSVVQKVNMPGRAWEPKRVGYAFKHDQGWGQRLTKYWSNASIQHSNILGKPWEDIRLHYTLGPELGRGRYGITYFCTRKSDGEEYACKSIAKQNLHHEADVEKINREIQIMHHLAGHDDVVSALKGAYEDKDSVHLVMELCKGGELSQRIMNNGYYSEQNSASLCVKILRLVEICHSLGVMHRDIKPENFLFADNTENSVLKVIDFGLSVFFKPGDVFTDTVGTASFLAPEVLRDKYGPEADVWSVGVILYILLSGVHPFRARTQGDTFAAILCGDLNFTREPWTSLSDASKDLVKRLLMQDPKKRITIPQTLEHTWITDFALPSHIP